MIQLDNAVKRYKKIILDELYEKNIKCWIGGGAIRDYFMGVPITTDHDIFFPNEDEFNKCLSYFKDNNCKIVWESDNGVKLKHNDRTFDLVKKYFPDPQSSINEFDFTVSMFAVDAEKVYYGKTTFIDLAKRQLMINKITYPASTLSRAFRYHTKGFKICLGEIKKIIEAIQDMPKEEKKSKGVDLNNKDEKETTSAEMIDFFIGID